MEELDLKELLQLFWEKRIHIILITAIFFIIGIIYSLGFVTPKYQAGTKLLLATNSSPEETVTESITTSDVTINSKLVSTYSELVKSNKVVREVISVLGIKESEQSIRNSITVSAISATEVIQIKVKHEDPVLATKIANETAKVFKELIKEYYGMENVHIVDEAEVPENPCNVNHPKTVLIFTFIGIVLASMYVLVLNMLDTTVKTEEDVERIAGLTVLASLPIYGAGEDKTKNKRKGGKR